MVSPAKRQKLDSDIPMTLTTRCNQCQKIVKMIFAEIHLMYDTHKFCSAACLDKYVRALPKNQLTNIQYRNYFNQG